MSPAVAGAWGLLGLVPEPGVWDGWALGHGPSKNRNERAGKGAQWHK